MKGVKLKNFISINYKSAMDGFLLYHQLIRQKQDKSLYYGNESNNEAYEQK